MAMILTGFAATGFGGDLTQELIVLGNGCDVVISFSSPTGVIRVVQRIGLGVPVVLANGTNMMCELAVGSDGAVHTLSVRNEGRLDIDFITRLVDAESRETNIVNPKTVLNGITNNLVATWGVIGQSDSRFVIRRLGRNIKDGSSQPLEATR